MFWNNACQFFNWQELNGVYYTVHQCLTELMHYGYVAQDSVNAAVCVVWEHLVFLYNC